ncbi:MAG TPA: IS4 family transposase [Chitinophagaceae bacterium]|nr:IS4 family transposase [Chitinophagaceae bacterium]
MNKNTLFTGQPIFNQVLSLIPRSLVSRLTRKYQGDRYCKKFHSYDHLVTMLFCTLHQCSSLREVITGMMASASRLKHLGLRSTPRRSTLSDANQRRNADFFADLYHLIYEHYYGSLPDSLKGKRLLDKLFVIDSTIVSLFSTVMQSTGSFGLTGKKKGGIKAHALVRAKDNLPCFVRLTAGKESDNSFLPFIKLPTGSVVVIDKGYRNYQKFIEWTNQKISWVSRLNERSVYSIVESRPVNERQYQQGVRHDYIINLGNPKTAYINPIQKVRLIEFFDQLSQTTFWFITNNFTFSASTIADIYKRRWQIELLFKRIKQNFQLHSFLGDNENAIRIQLWCTLIADLLLKIIKDKVSKKRNWSMANLAGLIRLHLGTYINLYQFLANPERGLINYEDSSDKQQLSMFPKQIRGA